ncbi:MAG: ROK family transcriptional regulator [Eubacteriales bacterium]|nr:ROK family transcriptional regulator [Eubacteriales bacterium]
MGLNMGMNNETLKRRNRGLVLRLIATGGCTTRIGVARRTGLSKMAVSNVISEFIEAGLIEQQSELPVGGSGRNPICLSLSPDAPKIVGLYVFRDECVAVLCDLRLTALKTCRVAMDREKAQRLDETLFAAVDQVMPPRKVRVWGIGVGAIGPVDLQRGAILTPPNFYGVHDFPIVQKLTERYALPVYLDSQYNCAALAEKYFGAGRPYQDFLFVGISNGIGSGVIVGGEISRNQSGLTSELGHTSINWHGNLCACGNQGCLETYAGTQVMEARLRKATGQNLDFQGFCHRAEKGNCPEIHALLTEMTDALACALTSEVNLFHPQAVLIGHEGCCLPDRYLRELERKINAATLVKGGLRVLRPALGAQAQVKGSACSLLSRLFEGEWTGKIAPEG